MEPFVPSLCRCISYERSSAVGGYDCDVRSGYPGYVLLTEDPLSLLRLCCVYRNTYVIRRKKVYVSNILSLCIRIIYTLRNYTSIFVSEYLHTHSQACTCKCRLTYTYQLIYRPLIYISSRTCTRRITPFINVFNHTETQTAYIHDMDVDTHKQHKQSQHIDRSTEYAREGYTTQSHTSGAPFCVTGCTGWDAPLGPHTPAALPCGRIAIPRV